MIAILVAVTVISASEAYDCQGPEVFCPEHGTCEVIESDYGDASYDVDAASYVDDGQCFDVPEWCWADGKDTL